MLAQDALDLCGCAHESLRPFNAGDPATYPAGTSGCMSACDAGTIQIPLPADGVLRFSSFTANGAFTIRFMPNAANTPVTLAVAGDITVRARTCCGSITIAGNAGTVGTQQAVGTGGPGGPGGWRGGRGHGQPLGVGGLTPGGNGEGPGGGWGATTNVEAIGGTFTGTPELDPIIGGSGGGGGSGNQQAATCIGGGGGGGGGALLVKANGRVTLDNFQVIADGGPGGDPADRACAQGGAGGSGGAVRIVARSVSAAHTARVSARAGKPGFRAGDATAGRIRLESVDNSARTALVTEPIAVRVRR